MDQREEADDCIEAPVFELGGGHVPADELGAWDKLAGTRNLHRGQIDAGHLNEQPGLLRRIHGWLRPGGVLLATVGHQARTGVAENWLGVPGGDMWWSHADAATYRQWLAGAHLHIDEEPGTVLMLH